MTNSTMQRGAALVRGRTAAWALPFFAGLVIKSRAASLPPIEAHAQRALSSSSASECPTEVAACTADTTCIACATSYNEALVGCFASLTSAYTCDDFEASFCCTVEGCEDNTVFAALVECEVEELDCEIIAIDECLADGSGAISGSDDLTTTAIPTTASTTSSPTSYSEVTTAGTGSDDIMPTTSTSSTLNSGPDSTTDTTSTDACLGELDGCEEDATCLACVDIITAAQDACQDSDYDRETAFCSEKIEVGCCQIADDLDCANNALIGAYYDCTLEEAGCDERAVDCLVDSSGSSLVADGDDSDTSLVAGEEDSASSLDADEEGGGDEEDENTMFNPFDSDEEEDEEDTDAASSNGSFATLSSLVGSVPTVAALLLAAAASANRS